MKKKILLADNQKEMCDREKTILNRASFDVYLAASGKEAFSIHKAEKLDIMIVSLDLPDIAGDKLCSMIRKEPDLKHVSIIIICANQPDSIERATHCGANAFITRPFHSEVLTEKVTKLLSIPRRQNYRVLLRASVKGSSSNQSFFCSSCDISVSGIMIETEKVLAKGDLISCTFFLPGFGQVAADAEVMRLKTAGKIHRYGMHFRGLDSKFRNAIEVFISARAEKES